MSLNDIAQHLKSRGNFGHAGRPGKRGGSMPGSSSTSAESLEESKVTEHKGKIVRLAGQEVTVRVGNSNVPRKGTLMRSGDGFKLIGRPTKYEFDQVTRVLGNTIDVK